MSSKVALVTGSSEPLSLGFAIARSLAHSHHVFLHARTREKGEAAVRALQKEMPSAKVDFVVMELTEEKDILAAVDKIPRLDVLVNNASIRVPPAQMEAFRAKQLAVTREADDIRGMNVGAQIAGSDQMVQLKPDDLLEMMRLNVGAPLRLVNAFLPALLASKAPRVVNVSSGRGSISAQAGMTADTQGIMAYNITKAALNQLTVHQSLNLVRLKPNAKVNACCPGNTKTKFLPSGTLTLEEGAAVATWLATLPDDGPTATFWSAKTAKEVEESGFQHLAW